MKGGAKFSQLVKSKAKGLVIGWLGGCQEEKRKNPAPENLFWHTTENTVAESVEGGLDKNRLTMQPQCAINEIRNYYNNNALLLLLQLYFCNLLGCVHLQNQ